MSVSCFCSSYNETKCAVKITGLFSLNGMACADPNLKIRCIPFLILDVVVLCVILSIVHTIAFLAKFGTSND